MVSPLHSAATMAQAIANDPSLVGVARSPAPAAAPVAQQPAYFLANPDVAAAYAEKSYGLSPEQFAQAHFEKFGQAEQRAAPSVASQAPLYTTLTAQSTPDQIAAAYNQFVSTGGGDTSFNQKAATDYLTNLGVSAPTIESAYRQYTSSPAVDQSQVVSANQTLADPIETLYQRYAGRSADPSGLEYWRNQFGSEVDPSEIGIFQRAIAEGIASGIESNADVSKYNKYFELNPDVAEDYAKGTYGLTPEEFARQHYERYGVGENRISPTSISNIQKSFTGGDTAETNAYFLANPDVAQAYANRAADPNLASTVNMTPAQFAAEHYRLYGSKPEEGRVDPNTLGILSGFEALGRGDFTEDQAKRILGEDTFNQYKSVFGGEANKYLTGILADQKLSGEEAIDFMRNARKYGIDTPEEFASLTGKSEDLFKALESGYDRTAKTLINSSLEAAQTDADRLKTGLALQDKFGFTYDDLAKATGFDTKQIKDWFEPVRNFEQEYTAAISQPDVSSKDILSFLDTAKNNGSIDAVYGSNIDSIKQRLDELNNKWSDYGVDGYQAENIYNQINQITNAAEGKNWNGSWAGGGDNAAKATAQKLVQKGVDNLADLKVEKNYEKTATSGEFYNGQRVQKDEDGRKFVVRSEQSGDGYNSYIEYLPKDAETVPAKIVGGGGYDDVYTYEPLTSEELRTYDPKTNTFEKAAGNKLIDGSSGKLISKSDDNNFVLDRYSTGNFFKGKDKTMGIMVTDNGVPVPYQTTQKSGLVYSPVFPIMASFLLPGIGSTISGGLASVGGSSLASGTLANAALTRGIIGGAMGELTGSGFGKGFVSGAAVPVISSGISSLLPAGMDPQIAKTVTNVGTSAVTGALSGRPIDWGSTLVNAGVQYGAQQLPFNLTNDQLNLLSGIATPLLQGQSINPAQLTGILANYAMKSQTPTKGAR